LDESYSGTLPDKVFLDVLMKVNFSLPKTQLMQIAASCTYADVGGGRSFAPGGTHVNYNLFLRRVEAVLKVMILEIRCSLKSAAVVCGASICIHVYVHVTINFVCFD
jgi:hypothetical protein